MHTICVLDDKKVLGLEGVADAPPRKTSRAVLINRNGLYAVMYSKKFDLHSLPGGGLEDGEDSIDALKREIMEETGCACDLIEELGCVCENRAHCNYTSISYYYVVHTNTVGGRIELTGSEIESQTSMDWYPFEKAVHLIRDRVHDTNQRKFLQARDVAALEEYAKKKI